MKKSIAKKIREIESVLGIKDYTVCTATLVMSGEDVLLSGFGKYPRTMEIDPKKEYEMDMDVLVATTWGKELKQAFYKKGMDGIIEIVRKEHDKRVNTEDI